MKIVSDEMKNRRNSTETENRPLSPHKRSDNGIKFIDVSVNKKRVTEQEAVKTVKEVYNEYQISDLNQCGKQQKYDIAAVLKQKGLSVRQIERLTGISHWIAQKG